MSGSSVALGANTSASTIGARAPNSSALRAASRSRTAPRPRGVASSRTARRTTSTPRSATPLHRPATTHSVPPRARCPSGQRSRNGPPQAPGSTSTSTTPPLAGAGSSSRTIAARVLVPCDHCPAHVTSRSRTAATPQSVPATPMMPTAAPSGARRASHALTNRTGNAVPHNAAPDNAPPGDAAPGSSPSHNPSPKAILRKRMGGRTGGPPSDLHQLHGPRPAAGRQPHLAEPLEQRHVELGLLLVAVEPQLDPHFALRRGYVARGEPVEGVHQHIAAAGVAAAEPGQLGA